MAKRKHTKKTFAQKLYKANVLPDGVLKAVPDKDVVAEKLANPPRDNEEKDHMGTL